MIYIYALLIPWMAILHRYRGTSYPLPCKNLYWCWLLVMPPLLIIGVSWQIALTWALGYLVWCFPGWMRIVSAWLSIDDAAYGQGRPVTWDEQLIITLGGERWTPWGITLRGMLWLIPLAVALAVQHQAIHPLSIIPLGFTLGYAIGDWTASDGDISKVAEPIVGMAWGLAMTLSVLA